jgi:hypothetical protein
MFLSIKVDYYRVVKKKIEVNRIGNGYGIQTSKQHDPEADRQSIMEGNCKA